VSSDINPRRYVWWAYRQLRQQNKIVWVPQIASFKTLERFLAKGAQDIELEQRYVRLQLDTVARQLQSGRTIREVLEDPLIDVSDTVRYVVARKSEVADIAARLYRGAKLDIENEPLYAELLSGFL
jgi:ketosteroid isomerase-like protein